MVNKLNNDVNQSISILQNPSIELDDGITISGVQRIINKKVCAKLGAMYHDELLGEYQSSFSSINSDDTIKNMVDSIINGIMVNQVNIPCDLITQDELIILKQEIEQEVLMELYPNFSNYEELQEYLLSKGIIDDEIIDIESELIINAQKISELSDNEELSLTELNLREHVKDLDVLLNTSASCLNDIKFLDLLEELKSVKYNLLNLESDDEILSVYNEINSSEFFNALFIDVTPFELIKTLNSINISNEKCLSGIKYFLSTENFIESVKETMDLCIKFIEYINLNNNFKISSKKRMYVSTINQHKLALVESEKGEEFDRFIQGYYQNPYTGKTIKEIIDVWNQREENTYLVSELNENRAHLENKLEKLKEEKKSHNLPALVELEPNNVHSINSNNNTNNIDSVIEQGTLFIQKELKGKVHTKTNIKKIINHLENTLNFSGDTSKIIPFLIIDFIDPAKNDIYKLFSNLNDFIDVNILSDLMQIHFKYIEIDIQNQKKIQIMDDCKFPIWHIYIDPKYTLNTKGELKISGQYAMNVSDKYKLPSKIIANFVDKYMKLTHLHIKLRTHIKSGKFYTTTDEELGSYALYKHIKLKDKNNQYFLNEEMIAELDPDLTYEELISVLESKKSEKVRDLKEETFESDNSDGVIEEKDIQFLLDEKKLNGELNEDVILEIERFFQFIQDKHRNLSLGKNISAHDTKVSLIYIILSGDEELFKKHFKRSYNSSLSSIGYHALLQEKRSDLEKKLFRKFLGKNYNIKGFKNVDFTELKQLLSTENNNQDIA